MEEAGFEEIGVYITRRNNMVARYIATQPVLELCERSFCRTGAWVSRRWWYQEDIDLEGFRERAAAALDREDDN